MTETAASPVHEEAPAPDRRAPSVAVLVPCRNEEATVAEVVGAFHAHLPAATVYVCDNGSGDATAERAERAGAVVVPEARPGKGHAVRRLLGDVDADVYVMVDGDATYDAAAAPGMVARLLAERLDMVTGVRRPAGDGDEFPSGHAAGNRLFTWLAGRLLGGVTADVLSGYRVMSRRFVKSFPTLSRGFEIEMDLTAHAADVDAACADVATEYRPRPEGSASKLHTVRDGWRILTALVRQYRLMRPARFFGWICFWLVVAAVALGIPVFVEYLDTGLVPRFPTAILAASLVVIAVVALTCGVILDSVAERRREAKRLAYLGHAPPGGPLG